VFEHPHGDTNHERGNYRAGEDATRVEYQRDSDPAAKDQRLEAKSAERAHRVDPPLQLGSSHRALEHCDTEKSESREDPNPTRPRKVAAHPDNEQHTYKSEPDEP